MKTIYVDFDGTIVDVMPRYHGILQSYLKKDKPIELDFNKYKCLKRQGIKDYNIVKSLCEGYELDLDDYLKYKRLNLESLEWLKMDKVIGNPKEAYDKLKNQGYKVVLLTKRRHEKNLFKQVNLLNIEKCFDEIVVVKPLLNQNVKLEYLKNRINDEDIIIGDSRDEMDAAEKLNIKSYFVTTGLWDESFAGSISDVFSCYNSVVNYIAGDKEELER